MTGLQKKQENIFAVMMLTDNITIVLFKRITVGRHDVDEDDEDDDGHLVVGNAVVDTCVQ